MPSVVDGARRKATGGFAAPVSCQVGSDGSRKTTAVGSLRVLLGDQLSRELSVLADVSSDQDIVLMAEVGSEAAHLPHHKQKIAFVWSAMRHFAADLRAEGLKVDYQEFDAPGNTGSLTGELRRALQRHDVQRVIVTEPSEWRVMEVVLDWPGQFGVPVEIRTDNRFLCSREQFQRWTTGRSALRLENFYRHMRRTTGWLMVGDRPEGGRWNFDLENRKPLPSGWELPTRRRFPPDGLTQSVIELVQRHFGHHFGELASFGWAVTRRQALEALDDFITNALPHFGDYQDAMRSGENWLYHSLLSPYLNVGLLNPRETCEAALAAYGRGAAPLPAVEAFVRQIIGWREFVRGVYWHAMPNYADSNFLEAQRPLPDFYWTADTPMQCLRETISSTLYNAYAHHIQRLMITGNFALLAGIVPKAVEEWYRIVYIDAFDWVELPNTHGMALYADGGLLSSKPYAASSSYINRMSDYCRSCVYDPKVQYGDRQCPFRFLYWNFLIVNKDKLSVNPRMAMPYRMLGRMSAQARAEITTAAMSFLKSLFD